MRDYLSDMLTRIRNGQKAKLFEIDLHTPVPKYCIIILEILYKEGFIRGFKKQIINNKIYMKVLLKYDLEGNPVINKIQRISKQGCRVYTPIKALWKVNNGVGVFLISTPKGILTDKDARFLNSGGEVLCYII